MACPNTLGWPFLFCRENKSYLNCIVGHKGYCICRRSRVNLPNALSLLRIFLVTPFLIAVIYRQFPLALIIFVVAGISDFLDGYLARRWKQQSLLGTFLDPLGDKLLITVAFISLCLQGLLPPWLAVTVVAKDLYTVIGAGVLHFSGNLSVAVPSLWGKLSTLLQIVAVGFALLSALLYHQRRPARLALRYHRHGDGRRLFSLHLARGSALLRRYRQ